MSKLSFPLLLKRKCASAPIADWFPFSISRAERKESLHRHVDDSFLWRSLKRKEMWARGWPSGQVLKTKRSFPRVSSHLSFLLIIDRQMHSFPLSLWKRRIAGQELICRSRSQQSSVSFKRRKGMLFSYQD